MDFVRIFKQPTECGEVIIWLEILKWQGMWSSINSDYVRYNFGRVFGFISNEIAGYRLSELPVGLTYFSRLECF